MKEGLSEQEVQDRIRRGQINRSAHPMTRTRQEIIKGNVLTYFNLINAVLFTLVLITGKVQNGLFFVTIVFNALIGIAQELKAKQILDQLSILVVQDVEVCRNGCWQTVKADRIVLNDRIRIKNGMQIPADASLVSGYLEVNESMLTGESKSLIKKPGDLLYAGTAVTSGEAEADVIHVGADNFSETILKDAKRYKPAKSMLQKDLNRLLGIVSILIVPTGIGLFLVQYLRVHLTWQQAVLKTVAGMVGMIPEGLVVLTSVALEISIIRLSKTQVLVQDLYSIESLARVDVLCLDKTGTLTQGKMQVQEVVPLNGASLHHIEEVMGSYVRVFAEGNATDNALRDRFPANSQYAESSRLPFSSDRKYAGVTFQEEGTFYLGASSFLFPEGHASLKGALEPFAGAGCRVVVLAHSMAEAADQPNLPADLEPVALIVLHDLLRPNVQQILQYFYDQGVDLKVISGDDPATVSALAQEAGVHGAEKYVDMSQQRNRDPRTFLEGVSVFGRVLPEQKKEMVKALQKQGHTVAMIGDGVNDVPALKTADVSIAMAAGSAAAKNSANIVLLTSDFGLMPGIVQEGRRVINNISRAASMYLVKTVFSVLLSLYVIFFGKSYPFLPVHLTLISTFCVGIPTFFLQLEPSFERVKGRFFRKAFRNAVPSALMVVLLALLVPQLTVMFQLDGSRENALLVIWTSFIYLYTLYRIYYPPTKLRTWVLRIMSVCMVLSMILFRNMLEVSLAWADLLVLIPVLLVIPILISAFGRAYDWVLHLFVHADHAED